MPCYKPQYAYVKDEPNKESGKFGLTWNIREANLNRPLVSFRCGKCIGCKLDYAKNWAIRCMNEASLYEANSFITLTYNDDHMPVNGKVAPRDFQLFMKRLRRKIAYNIVATCGWDPDQDPSDPRSSPRVRKYYKPFNVKYFYCGEYGEKGGRPHYHAILFNYSPTDKVTQRTDSGQLVEVSEELQRLWSDVKGDPIGFVSIGDVTFESCSYVARYVLKKLDMMSMEEKKRYLENRQDLDDDEFVQMSRRGGIGLGFFKKWKDDIYNQDFMLVRNKYKVKPPRYYDNQLELSDPERHGIIKARREEVAKASDNSWSRLRRREVYRKAVSKKLRRSYDEEIVQCVR